MQQINLATGHLITKAALARHLGISTQSIRRYLILTSLIPEFNGDYPQLNGQPYSRMALTKYQCWVVVEIAKLSRTYPQPVLISLVRENSDHFSKANFESSNQSTEITLVA